jgi:hypothetical protein
MQTSRNVRCFTPFVWECVSMAGGHPPLCTLPYDPEPCRSEDVRTFSPHARRRHAFIATGWVQDASPCPSAQWNLVDLSLSKKVSLLIAVSMQCPKKLPIHTVTEWSLVTTCTYMYSGQPHQIVSQSCNKVQQKSLVLAFHNKERQLQSLSVPVHVVIKYKMKFSLKWVELSIPACTSVKQPPQYSGHYTVTHGDCYEVHCCSIRVQAWPPLVWRASPSSLLSYTREGVCACNWEERRG